MAGRALASSQLEVDATDLPECLHHFPKRSFGKKTVVQRSFQLAWFSKWPIIMRLTTGFSALPEGKCSKKRRIRPLLKQTLPL